MKFKDMVYTRPNIQKIKEDLSSLEQKVKNAKTKEDVLTAFYESEKIGEEYSTMASLAYVRHTIDTGNRFYDEENNFFDNNGPIVGDMFRNLNLALLDSDFRAELEKDLGPLFFKNLELGVKSSSPETIELQTKENELMSEYQRLFASATVEWEGETLPLPMLGVYKQSPDREIRKKAYLKDAEFFKNNKKEFDRLYDELIKNRNSQAKILGYENFIKLGYDRLGRNCYGPSQVALFRNEIAEWVVPLVCELKKQQAKRIEVDKIHLYDNDLMFKEGNVKPKGTAEEILKAGINMYKEMSEETCEFITFMEENELFDLLSAKGKAPGGYCTEFALYKAPFIFSNFNGTSGDVDVLTHEAGHAFAYYTAARKGLISSYISPTIEACEVHSMSMEFLTMPWHKNFFFEETDRYEYYHAADALIFLPYGCMVDEFQHIMYEKSELTPEERDKVWLSLEEKYRPYLNLEDLPFYSEGGGWQRQLHIYLYPLYYIDYCMAEAVAFGFFAESLEDYKKALEKYFKFVDGAGTKTFEELVTSAGLPIPYQKGNLKKTVETVKEWLKL